MDLRPFQQRAVTAVLDVFKNRSSTLLVMPTGTGKTVVFTHIAKAMKGRVLILAHREELIFQAADKVLAITGERPDVEMAKFEADQSIWTKTPVVVGSVQTHISGDRMEKFRPDDFDLLIIDEAHHAITKSYKKVLDYYRQNHNLKVLGVTATPDRGDGTALRRVFETVAFQYGIRDAIQDGWLVPIHQRAIWIERMDFSGLHSVAGEFKQDELDEMVRQEEVLHGFAHPIMELCEGKKVLMFTVSVKHAENLAEIFNRWQPGVAQWVCGRTPKEERREIVEQFSHGDFRILVNVGVYTEGFDEPSIDVIAMGRPTKSRSLYAQMVGRGTRPLNGIIDWCDDAESRRDCITESRKPWVDVIDFCGNSGRHMLITAADALAGSDEDPDVLKRAAKKAKARDGESYNVADELDEAKKEVEAEREARKRRLERSMQARSKIKGRAVYHTKRVDPFDVMDIRVPTVTAVQKKIPPTPKMVAFLQKQGIDTNGLSKVEAGHLCGAAINRMNAGMCSFKQAKLLQRYGYDTDALTRKQASQMIDLLAKNKWKPLAFTPAFMVPQTEEPVEDPLLSFDEAVAKG